jgi:hypothetical protein
MSVSLVIDNYDRITTVSSFSFRRPSRFLIFPAQDSGSLNGAEGESVSPSGGGILGQEARSIPCRVPLVKKKLYISGLFAGPAGRFRPFPPGNCPEPCLVHFILPVGLIHFKIRARNGDRGSKRA